MKGCRRKRKTTVTVDRIIQSKIKAERRKTASSVKQQLEKEISIIIHSSPLRNRVHEIGLYSRVAQRKPLVNKRNREKQIQYAKTMMEKSFSYSKDILWSDEYRNSTFLV